MDSITPTPQPHPQPQSRPSAGTDTVDLAPTYISLNSLLPYRAQLVQKAAPKIPITAEGLPVGFYRADLLPASPVGSTEEIQSLKNAYVDLSYEHGYPTLPDSRPYWQKLDFEPGFAFGAFQIYLELINDGPREISQLQEHEELIQIASRMKGLTPPNRIKASELGQMINEFSVLYYWRTRAKAHDLYKEASFRHMRLRRQMSSEERHYKLATKLMEKLQNEVFEDKEFWENMSGKTAVDLLSKLVAIERVSLGLPAAGPLSQKETPESTTFEMIMRSLGQRANNGNTYENNGNQVQSRELIDNVLKDKDAASNLQELVIRITKATHEQLPNPHEGRARAFKGRNRPHAPAQEIITAEDITGFDISGAPQANLDNDSSVEGDDTEAGKNK